MSTQTDPATQQRIPLNRERVLEAAVDLADRAGIESVSMRKLGQELGVEAMSLYNHVKNKEDLLDGMVDVIVNQIVLPNGDTDWKTAVRNQILSARAALGRHQWAAGVIETRVTMSPTLISYFDSMIGTFRKGGFSYDLIHHAMHALSSRMLGFTRDLYDDSDALDADPAVKAVMLQQMTDVYPNISAMLREITHDEDGSVVTGQGCDDNTEFTFALDLILDGLERLQQQEG